MSSRQQQQAAAVQQQIWQELRIFKRAYAGWTGMSIRVALQILDAMDGGFGYMGWWRMNRDWSLVETEKKSKPAP